MLLSRVPHGKVAEYFEKNDMVLIPVGAMENHGTHLCLGTDHMVPNYIAKQLDTLSDILIAETVPYGVSDSHTAFPGSISIGYEGLYLVLTAIVDSLYAFGARKFIFLNGHGGNNGVIDRICLETYKRGGVGVMINWWTLAGQLNPEWKGGHGGAEETSAILHIDKEAVFMDLVEDFTPGELSDEIKNVYMSTVSFKGGILNASRPAEATTSAGWYGDDHPSTATEKWGREMLECVTNYCAEFIEAFRKVKR